MKTWVYVAPHTEDHALARVDTALVQYAPRSVSFVWNRDYADLEIHHVVGRLERTLRATQGKRYAVIQYAVRSTLRPSTEDWLPLWKNAQVVWSYYPLFDWCVDDGVDPDFRLYHAPLGVDGYYFKLQRTEPRYLVATSGRDKLTESVRETWLAAERVGGKVFHLGPDLGNHMRVAYSNNMSDARLATQLNACQYVAALRRKEGFELPAAEGLLCGTRPICFDRLHYRQWYGDWAEYIPEESRENVIESLIAIFQRPYRPVTIEERMQAQGRFNWKTIVEGFWDAVHA